MRSANCLATVSFAANSIREIRWTDTRNRNAKNGWLTLFITTDRCQFDTQCLRRNSWCKFSRIGCPWRGPEHERQEHENQCAHPHRTGAEVMDSLLAMDQEMTEEKKLYDNIFDLLGYEKITFNGISRYCQACTVKLTQNSRNPTETVPY